MRRTPPPASCPQAAGKQLLGHRLAEAQGSCACMHAGAAHASATVVLPRAHAQTCVQLNTTHMCPLLPCWCRVLRWQVPPDAAFFTDAPVRVDSGVVQGDTVSPC